MLNLIPIVAQATDLFTKYGVRSVTMEDLSRSLGMSKKTIYNYVSNKEDLVAKVIDFFLAEECKTCDQISNEHENAVEEMVEYGRYVSQHLTGLNPSMVYDLQKYYRKSWARIEQHRMNYVYSKIKQNIENGKRQGMYRADLDAALITNFYINQSHLLITEQAFPQADYDLVKVYWEFLRYHFSGICTEDGKIYMEKYLKRAKSSFGTKRSGNV